MAETGAPSFLRTLQILTASLMAAPIVIAVVGATVLTDGFEEPPTWMIAVVAAHGAITLSLLQVAGLRTIRPIAPGTPAEDAQRTSASTFQSNLILRFALSEAVALVALALAFTADAGGMLVLLLGVILSVALMAWFVWPGDRVIVGVQEALEREGGVSHLRAALDAPPAAAP